MVFCFQIQNVWCWLSSACDSQVNSDNNLVSARWAFLHSTKLPLKVLETDEGKKWGRTKSKSLGNRGRKEVRAYQKWELEVEFHSKCLNVLTNRWHIVFLPTCRKNESRVGQKTHEKHVITAGPERDIMIEIAMILYQYSHRGKFWVMLLLPRHHLRSESVKECTTTATLSLCVDVSGNHEPKSKKNEFKGSKAWEILWLNRKKKRIRVLN